MSRLQLHLGKTSEESVPKWVRVLVSVVIPSEGFYIVNLYGWKAHSNTLLHNSCFIDTTRERKTCVDKISTADKIGAGRNGDVKIVNLYGWKARTNILIYNSCSINITIG